MIAGQRDSHIFLTDGKHKLTVPRHDPIKKGTLLSILQQAGLTREEVRDLTDFLKGAITKKECLSQ